jgi:hypothetical protein
MTQKNKILQLKIALMKVKSIAESIRREGNNYDMLWHKNYCNELTELCDKTLKETK